MSLIKEKDNAYYKKRFLEFRRFSKTLCFWVNRPGSSSMYEPDSAVLLRYGFKNKDFHLFDVTKTAIVECDTLSSCLK